jgi:hypothetical protein
VWEQTWVRRFRLRSLPAPGPACSANDVKINGRRTDLGLVAGGRKYNRSIPCVRNLRERLQEDGQKLAALAQAAALSEPGQGRPPKPGKTRTKQRSERLAQAKEAAAGPVLLASGNLKKRPWISPGHVRAWPGLAQASSPCSWLAPPRRSRGGRFIRVQHVNTPISHGAKTG